MSDALIFVNSYRKKEGNSKNKDYFPPPAFAVAAALVAICSLNCWTKSSFASSS